MRLKAEDPRLNDVVGQGSGTQMKQILLLPDCRLGRQGFTQILNETVV